MELNFKFNNKEIHILYRILAILLCIGIFSMSVLSLAYIDITYSFPGQAYLIAALIHSFISLPAIIAVFKYYK
jgi:hypothetical protein